MTFFVGNGQALSPSESTLFALLNLATVGVVFVWLAVACNAISYLISH